MIWLVKLYPPSWRRRYGEELKELIGAQPRSLGLVIDILAGAIDAWIYPQSSTAVSAPADAKGGMTMVGKMLQLRCAGAGPIVTTTDAVKSGSVMVGGSALLVLVWMWVRLRFGGSPYMNALMPMTYFVPLLIGLRYTSLKGRSTAVQTTFIVGLSAILVALLLSAEWLTRFLR